MVRSIGKYMGLRFEDRVYPHLASTYGGHPYLIRIACSEISGKMDTTSPHELPKVVVEDFKSNQSEIKARLTQPIRDILLSLVWWYPDEYDLLRILAKGDTDFVNEYLNEVGASVIQLSQYGILRDTAGEFAISDLREFLRENGKNTKQRSRLSLEVICRQHSFLRFQTWKFSGNCSKNVAI